jgi:hypothetical protein
VALELDAAGGGETTDGGEGGGGDEGMACFEGDAPELDKFSKARSELDAMLTQQPASLDSPLAV